MSQTIYPLSEWNFNEDVSDIFEHHVRQSVPLYDSIQHLIAHLSDFFIQPNTVVYDLGCATGETIFQLNHRHDQPSVTYVGIDESESMLQKAVEKNKNNRNIQFVKQSIENYFFEQKSHLILSVLTLQFIPIEKRGEVVKHVYDALIKGGAFLFVEKSYPEFAKVQDVFTQIYHDEKEEHGLSPLEIREKDKSLRGVLNSLTATENLHLLKSSGFTTVEVFFKYLNFTGFLAIK